MPIGRHNKIVMAGNHPYTRISFLPHLSASLAPKYVPPTYATPFIIPRIITSFWILKVGSKGEDVKKLQEKLGTSADGSFGPGTEKLVKEWQSKKWTKFLRTRQIARGFLEK